MEFLCPSCQKMLTVPEQFAGQPMKCPLCGNAFTAPSLAPSPPTANPPAETSTYSMAPEPQRPAAIPPPAPKPPPEKPKEPALEKAVSLSEPPPAAPPSGEYGRKFTLQVKPHVLPYIPAGALVLVFILTFFAWVGSYPGKTTFAKQNAWQAAFDSYSTTLDQATLEKAGKDYNLISLADLKPGVSVLTLFWLLIFLVLLVIAVAVVVLPRLQIKLPPVIQDHWRWRMIIIAGIAVLLLLFMIAQDMAGFPLEDSIARKAEDKVTVFAKDDKSLHDLLEGVNVSSYAMQHTSAYRLVFFLLLVTVLAALLDFWIEKRGPSKPLPRIDILW